MAIVSMSDLLKSGVHFGHQTRRWNPKMKPYILTERNGIYIIDLQETLNGIEKAYEFVKETVAHSGTVLFVGTKKQAQEAIEQQAQRVEMPYVNHRWLGGMLTNFNTVHKRLQRLKELEHVDFDDVAGSGRTKKELLMMRREKDKLARTLGGIRNMVKTPSAIWIVDTNKEHLAVAEARKLNIPIIAVLDTNCDPDEVDYAIAGNDDAIRAVGILTRVIADACAEGIIERSQIKKTKEQSEAQSDAKEAPAEGEDPIPEWQEELLRGDDPAQSSSEEKIDEPKTEEEASVQAAQDTTEAETQETSEEENKDNVEQQEDADNDA
ncbi:MAG: 30S ribosomal protein S2 [Actinomycetaceae bacterium]|nr:30S ribosomal protein S2 [Actinomycetaceae bacterium]